jgi:hypothetical protein
MVSKGLITLLKRSSPNDVKRRLKNDCARRLSFVGFHVP